MAKKKPRPPAAPVVSGEVRAAIRAYLDGKRTIQHLADAAGVGHQVVARFLDGGDLKLTTLDRLAGPLDLVTRRLGGGRTRRG